MRIDFFEVKNKILYRKQNHFADARIYFSYAHRCLVGITSDELIVNNLNLKTTYNKANKTQNNKAGNKII